jgi:aspartate/methionine/tyrosine aminotransferase
VVLAVVVGYLVGQNEATVARLQEELASTRDCANAAESEASERTLRHEAQLAEVSAQAERAQRVVRRASRRADAALARAKEARTVAEAEAAAEAARAAQQQVEQAQTATASCEELLAYADKHPGWVPNHADRVRCNQAGYAE